jgi:hypothetical protein
MAVAGRNVPQDTLSLHRREYAVYPQLLLKSGLLPSVWTIRFKMR